MNCSFNVISHDFHLLSFFKGRAKQLYNAGYRKIEDIARAKPQTLVSDIEHMSKRLANQLVSAAKVIIIKKNSLS